MGKGVEMTVLKELYIEMHSFCKSRYFLWSTMSEAQTQVNFFCRDSTLFLLHRRVIKVVHKEKYVPNIVCHSQSLVFCELRQNVAFIRKV